MSEAPRVLDNVMCWPSVAEEVMEADRILAKPLVSEPTRPRVPVRVLERAECSTRTMDEPTDPVRFFVIPLV